MSRTYRRKKVTKLEDDYYTYEFNYISGYIQKEYLKGKVLAEATRRYHSEHERTMHQVPKWYKVLFCRRPFRAAERRCIIKIMKGKEEVMFPKPVKDAMYYW